MSHGQISFSNLKTKISLGLILVMLFGFLPVITNVKNGAVVNSESTCDWTMFGKTPDGNRVVGSECAPDIQKLEEQWSLDNYQTSPIVWGDRLYCGFLDFFCCVNATNGAIIWRSEKPESYGYPPTLENGRIYLQYYTHRDLNQRMQCLDALTGKEIWSYLTPTTNPNLKVYNNKLYFTDKDSIICVDGKTRQILWTYKNAIEFIIYNGKVLTKTACLDADTGTVIWSIDKKYYGEFCVSDGKIYQIARTAYDKPVLNCFEADSGTLLWSMPRDPNANYPVISNNKIYFRACDYYGKKSNAILCYDLDSKKLLWKLDLGDEIPGTVTHVGNTIVTGTKTGKVFFISSDTGKIIRQMDFDGSIGWEIVAAQEKIYIQSNYTLHCLGVTPHVAKPAGWLMAGGNSEGSRYSPDGTKTKIVKPLWTFDTSAPVTSSAAVQKDKAFFGSDDGNVYCVNTATGDKIWSLQTGDHVQTCPAIWLGKVLAGSNDGKMYCLSLQTGKKLWEFDAKASIRSSPVVSEGMVFFGTDGKMIYCLDIENGDKRWEVKTANPVRVPLAVDRDKIFAAYADPGEYGQATFWMLHCLDSKTGSLVWNYELSPGTDSAPIISDGKVFFSTLDNKILCIDGETGIKAWDVKLENAVTTSISADYSRIFFGTADKTMHCLNRDNGATCWETIQDGNLNSSLAVCDKFIYFGTSQGKIVSLDKISGQMVWTIETGSAVTSSPSICEGKIYAGSWDGKLYCIGDTPQPEPVANAFDWTCSDINNQHNRVLPSDSAPKTDKFKQLWATPVYGTPRLIAGRSLYHTTGWTNRLAKVDAITGAIMWDKGYNWDQGAFDRISLGAYSNGRLFCGGVDAGRLDGAMIMCISDDDGSVVWNLTIERGFKIAAVQDDKVIVESDKTYCLDAATGKTLWESDFGGLAVSSPGKIYFTSTSYKAHWLKCLDINTGKELWNSQDYYDIGNLVWADGKLFGTVFSQDKNATSHVLHCINAQNGQKIWQQDIPTKTSDAPIVADGKIFLGAGDFINVLDESTGGFIDKFDYVSPERTDDSGTLTYSDGKLYWRSSRGYLYCKDAKTGKMMFTIEDSSLRLNINQEATPIIVGLGRIYTPVQGRLTCWGDDTSTKVCDWPMPGRDNSRNANASEPCPDNSVKVHQVWQFDAGSDYKMTDQGVTMPVMAQGNLYFYSNNHKFWSMDAKTGKTNWSIEIDKEQGCYGQAVYGNGKVFFVTNFTRKQRDGRLVCVSAVDGKQLWYFDLGEESWPSPVFWDDKIYIGSNKDNEYCLDASTGKVIWEYPYTGRFAGTAAVVDGKIYFGSEDNKFQCLDAMTGKLIWTFATGEACGSTVTVAEGKVYFTSNDFFMYCLDARTGSLIFKYYISAPAHAPTIVGNRLYLVHRSNLECIDIKTQKTLWKVDTNRPDNSPTVVRDRVYLGSDDNSLTCFNAYTGETIWRLEEFRAIQSAIIWQDGKLYFGAYKGFVYCYEEEN